jgi:hypothetical protein
LSSSKGAIPKNSTNASSTVDVRSRRTGRFIWRPLDFVALTGCLARHDDIKGVNKEKKYACYAFVEAILARLFFFRARRDAK